MSGKLPRANKGLGQHFLRDSKVIERICNDFAEEARGLIEIGPGPQALTRELARLDKPFFVVEKDARFEGPLQELLGADHVVLADALEVDLASEIQKRQHPGPIWLVSNLPYNVSVPLLLRFIQTPAIEYMTLMFQKEVAQKVFDFTHGKNPMGSLMALTQTYFEVKLLCQVPPGAFVPPPEVNSTVLSLKRRAEPPLPLNGFPSFEKFLRQVFQFKRKQVLTVLKSSYPEPRVREALYRVGLAPEQRAESFTLDQLQNLYLAITETP